VSQDDSGTIAWVLWNNGVWSGGCYLSAEEDHLNYQEFSGCGGTFCCGGKAACLGQEFREWDDGSCACYVTPLIVALDGSWQNAMTSAPRGALFRLTPTMERLKVAWPRPVQQIAGWLARDRDGNGQIDDGSELYGSATSQPTPPGEPRHGFIALRTEDTNGDGLVTEADANFASMAVWFDINHDGLTQPRELQPLTSIGITSISLRYRVFGQVDSAGNQFLYEGTGVQQVGSRLNSFRIYDVVPRTAEAPWTTRDRR
jgi:hypothetical protein